jgi:hypothetical protein
LGSRAFVLFQKKGGDFGVSKRNEFCFACAFFLIFVAYEIKTPLKKMPKHKSHKSHKKHHSHGYYRHGHRYGHDRGLNAFVNNGPNYYGAVNPYAFVNPQANAYVDSYANAYANAYVNAYGNAYGGNVYGNPYGNYGYGNPYGYGPYLAGGNVYGGSCGGFGFGNGCGAIGPNQVYYQNWRLPAIRDCGNC